MFKGAGSMKIVIREQGAQCLSVKRQQRAKQGQMLISKQAYFHNSAPLRDRMECFPIFLEHILKNQGKMKKEHGVKKFFFFSERCREKMK